MFVNDDDDVDDDATHISSKSLYILMGCKPLKYTLPSGGFQTVKQLTN